MFKKPYILVVIALFPVAVSTLFLYLNLSRALGRELISREVQIRESQTSKIVDELRVRVDVAWDIVNHYCREGLGQEACKKALACVSLNQDGYLYVQQIDTLQMDRTTIVVHPDVNFVGNEVTHVIDLDRVNEIYYRGQIYPLGHPTIAGIQPTNISTEIINTCLHGGSGVIRYFWAKVADGKASQVGYPKITYIRYFPQWRWAIGSGAYADAIDALIEEQMQAVKANAHRIWSLLFFSTLEITLVLGVISVAVSHVYSRRMIRYENSLLQSRERLSQEVEKSRKSEQIFKTLINSLPQKVVLKDKNSTVLCCNDKYADSLHCTTEQVIGKNEHDFYSRMIANKHVASDRAMIDQNKTLEGFLRRRINGQLMVTRVLKTPVKGDHERADGILCVLEDFTERIRNEERLQAANAELEQTNRRLRETQIHLVQSEKLASIGQLAAGIAHEINNPMCYVVGNSHALQQYIASLTQMIDVYDRHAKTLADTGDPRFEEHIRQIHTARSELDIDHICTDIQDLLDDSQEGMNRVLRIVKNLRRFSRIDQPEDITAFDLNEGIRSTLAIANNELTDRAQVRTELGDIPEVQCNSGEVNQVILNILVNAAQAIGSQDRSDTGQIVIQTYRKDDDVVCTIADDGPGISQENLPRIFDPFFTTKPVGQGTGLGLHVSYDIIVRQHGGQLLVESELGKGTTFTMKIPISGKPPADLKKGQPDERQNSAVC